MSHHSQPRDLDPGRTRIGMETLGRPGLSARGGGATSGPRLGARVGRSGQLFETDGSAPGRPLAIKLFPWAAGLPPQVVRNFTEEAARVASLRHPHVVAVTDSGSLGDGTPYLITGLLRGQTLDERLQQRGALPLTEVASVVRGVAAALSVAHAAGVIHRELRADNVFIEETAAHPNGFPRLLDFGVARLTAGARDAGRILRDASASEVAPELRRDQGAGADHSADQFALAALTYRLLHGTTAPYGVPAAGAFQRLWEQPARLDGGGKSSGAGAIEAVLARAMSWQPERRFDSVASFLYAFEEALPASQPQSPVARVTPAPPPAVVAAPLPPPALPPSSLTQQFFAEGDRQEAETLARAAVEPPAPIRARDSAVQRSTEAAAVSATFERVPRRRAPWIGAVALGLAALAIIARTAVRAAHDDRPAPTPDRAAAAPAPGSAVTVPPPHPAPALSPPLERPAPPPAPALAPARAAHLRRTAPAPLPSTIVLTSPAPVPPAPGVAPAVSPTPAPPAPAAAAATPDPDDEAPAPAPEAQAAPAEPPAAP
jgi:serine/threonine-protein kinase